MKIAFCEMWLQYKFMRNTENIENQRSSAEAANSMNGQRATVHEVGQANDRKVSKGNVEKTDGLHVEKAVGRMEATDSTGCLHLGEHERLDDLQNGYYIIQDDRSFCFGADAVLLADFARVKPGETALDFCSGGGIVPILLKNKTAGAHFYGLEIQSESVRRGIRSVAYNRLERDITLVDGDVKEAESIFGAASMQVVTCNPPYMKAAHGLTNDRMQMTIARHEVLLSLDELLASAAKVLAAKGRFYMIHRPNRLAEIMGGMMRCCLEPKRMRLVYPYVDREPTMVMIEGLKGGRPQMTVEKPLIMFDAPGVYTDEILEIYGRKPE